jgi:hypothetical protein
VTRLFRYSWRALALDYAGGATGFGIALGLLLFAHPAAPVAWVLAATAALFLVYSGRTVCRQLTHIELDETGIRARGPAVLRLGAVIRWEDLRSLRLDYYSTRRDPEGRSMQGGWMQLRLRDARRTIRIDSDLDGFAALVGAAAQAAALRELALDIDTVGNIQELLG